MDADAIRNIIFDFDGTLMDTAPVILTTMKAAFRELGLEVPTDAQCKSTIGLRLEEVPAALLPEGQFTGAEFAATYRRIFPKYNAPGLTRTFPMVIETLRQLSEDGYRLAIASSRSRGSLLDFIESLHVDSIFSAIVGGDDVALGKPNPEPVLVVLKSQAWAPGQTLVVGDADVDILMGQRAGCRTCAVTYGNGTRKSLEAVNPDYMADSFGEIATLLYKTNAKP